MPPYDRKKKLKKIAKKGVDVTDIVKVASERQRNKKALDEYQKELKRTGKDKVVMKYGQYMNPPMTEGDFIKHNQELDEKASRGMVKKYKKKILKK